MDPHPTIDAMSTAAQTLTSGDVRAKIIAIQTAQDALDAAKALLLAELDASKDYELDGASTLNAWVRTQLRLNAGQATALVKSVAVLRELPLVAAAAAAGDISAAHLRAFRYGLEHVGPELMRRHENLFVAVALEHEPGELFEAVKHLKDVTHPEDLDDAYERGMDKQDFQVNTVPDGWHITGFLNTITGAKLKKVLDSVSKPDGEDDQRSGSERRVQGLDDLLSAILTNGLPADKGLKPQLSVFANADTLEAAAERVRQETEHPYRTPDPMPDVEPATLAGHGHIGPHLLMYFLCVSEFTAFLMKEHGGNRQAQILNAVRDHRPSAARQAPGRSPAAVRNERLGGEVRAVRPTTSSGGPGVDPPTSTSSSGCAPAATTSSTAAD